jgi:hypothetical protein
MIVPEITVLVKLVEVCNYKNSILIIEQNIALKNLQSGRFYANSNTFNNEKVHIQWIGRSEYAEPA